MKTSKEVALTVAGIVALLTTGQTMVHAASTLSANQTNADAQLTVSMDDMVSANASNNNIKFADQNIRVSSNTKVTSEKIADVTKSSADKAAEKAAKAAKQTAAKQEAAKKAEKAAEEKAAKEAEAAAKQAEKEAKAAEKEAEKAAAAEAAAEEKAAAQTASAPTGSGSVYDQFIAAGGTPAMWQSIVLPESGGNPDIVSPNGYRGLGQTKEGWGSGSVAQQTQGMLGYASSRYGSVEGALSFRAANGWW